MWLLIDADRDPTDRLGGLRLTSSTERIETAGTTWLERNDGGLEVDEGRPDSLPPRG